MKMNFSKEFQIFFSMHIGVLLLTCQPRNTRGYVELNMVLESPVHSSYLLTY